MRSETMVITPELAGRWLTANKANPYFDHWKNRVMPQYLGGAK